ncbi:MAG: S8 family serine peptidase [Actinomycetota bacterium]|nr:S8 family serine peptidase [Actinomycetota bacterium]
MRKLISTIVLALAGALCAAAPAAASSSAEAPAYVPGEVIVGLEGGGERLLELPASVPVGEAASSLRGNPGVAYALPNYIARASSAPNDPGLGTAAGDWRRTQWNFLPCGSLCTLGSPPASSGAFEARGGINAVGAWEILKQRRAALGKGAKVAVLDTGVAFRSKRPGFLRSPDFTPKQFAPGFDFVKKNDMPLDRDGHGTHVAGTIAERTGNGFGLTGLVPRAKLIPVRVLDANGLGNARDIAAGIRFAAKQGADVINMSFEFALSVDSCAKIKSVCSAIKFAAKRGSALVSAAGNSTGEPTAFPAGAPKVIGVGRTTKDACLAAASRTGAGLDLVAPGGGLPATPSCGSDDALFSRGAPILQLTFSGAGFRSFGYPGFYEGTSMSAAHVSGVAAMIAASRVLGPNPSPAAIECQLEATARKNSATLGQSYDPRLFGAGLLDAAAAVTSRAPGC